MNQEDTTTNGYLSRLWPAAAPPPPPETPSERTHRLALEKARLAYRSERKREPGWRRPPDGTGRVFR